jgi:hypothetical protein
LGFEGQLEQLSTLLDEAEADTNERRILSWWRGLNAPKQLSALMAAYRHAHKHNMSISTFEDSAHATLVLSRPKGFTGVCLGRVEVTLRGVRWHFYRGNKLVGERVWPFRLQKQRLNRPR